MLGFIKIVLCLTSLYCATSVPIFGEFRFKKHYEVLHKPIAFPPFKPMEIIKEIVTPFGKFGLKHTIGKRDLDNMKTVNVEPEDVSVVPPPAVERYEVVEEQDAVPVLPSPSPPMIAPVTSGMSPLIENNAFLPAPSSPMIEPVTPGMGPLLENGAISPQVAPHFVEIKPIPALPPPPVVITPPSPRVEQPPRGFFTDIAREEAINEYLKLVEREPVAPLENNIEQEKPIEVPKVDPPPPNPFVRGSRLALYFGNLLLDVFTQFLGGSRVADVINRPFTI